MDTGVEWAEKVGPRISKGLLFELGTTPTGRFLKHGFPLDSAKAGQVLSWE